MYEKPRVNVKVERGSTFTFTTVAFHTSTLFEFTHVKPVKGGFPLSRNFYVRTDVNFNWLYVRKLK